MHILIGNKDVTHRGSGCDSLLMHILTENARSLYYVLINRAKSLYEETFVLMFKAYKVNAVLSVRLESQNKYFRMN